MRRSRSCASRWRTSTRLSARRSARALCRSSATATGCWPCRCRRSARSAIRSPAARGSCSTRSPTASVPVVAPLAVGPLNVNADDAAAALALGVGAKSLVFLTDVAGLYVDDEVVDAIDVREANRMLAAGAFDGGIVPKLRAATLAAASGITATIGRTAVIA